MPPETIQLTILMPCLNEALTVATCIRKALAYLRKRGITGEVVVADNGSTDGSQLLATQSGARVVGIDTKGYGAALIGGINAARGRYVIMADSDDSYDFTDLDGFLEKLNLGYELVIGNRFTGGIMPGAMPVLNRYLGNPVLSLVGRTLFSAPVRDFHCGIRGFDRKAILGLGLRASGMEFASEMVVKATLAHLSIAEVPTTLNLGGRNRPPHLRPWRDGWRHLRFMLLRSPQWLFFYPGLALTLVGLAGAALLTFKPVRVSGILTLDINSLLYLSVAAIVGMQITFFGLFALALSGKLNLQIASGLPERLLRTPFLKGALACGVVFALAGMCGALYAILQWGHASFGALVPSEMMRITIPSVTTLALGTQIVFGVFLLGFIKVE